MVDDYMLMIRNARDAATDAIVFPSTETRDNFRSCMWDTIENCLPDDPLPHAAKPRVSLGSFALGILAGAVVGKALIT